jgi:phenylalanyl-tRNA synthetase beta chain
MERFARLVGAEKKRILNRLPFVGLDIESVTEKAVRVEYSPNRPDFGTDYGIARALKGVMGIEVGLRRYDLSPSKVVVTVDKALSTIRPYIACAVVTGLRIDDEDVRQVISLQEDLHNGLGRRRKKAAIGLHDLRVLTPPIRFAAVPKSSAFAPLDMKGTMTLEEVLTRTATGQAYAVALQGARRYPVLIDSKGLSFSFPPIVNSEATRVTGSTDSLFVEVTSTDMRTGDDVLAVLVTTLAEMGGSMGSVVVDYGKTRRVTPDLRIQQVRLDSKLISRVTGLDLAPKQLVQCIQRSRLDVKGKTVLVPRYRLDILHPVDIAEEVALGYGIDRIRPQYPPSKQPGSFNKFNEFLESAADIMVASGMTEMMTYELVDEPSLYTNFERSSIESIRLDSPKSLEHSLLRDSAIPSLMTVMARNVKEEYPQRIFEIGRVYNRAGRGVEEAWHLGCLIGYSQASYSEAKMFLDAFCKALDGRSPRTKPALHWAFTPGRSAVILFEHVDIGVIGEVKPAALHAFGVNVPVCGFEIDLSRLNKQLK